MTIETKLKNMGYGYFDNSLNERIYSKEYNKYFCQIVIKNNKITNYYVVPYRVYSYSDLDNIKGALDKLINDLKEIKNHF